MAFSSYMSNLNRSQVQGFRVQGLRWGGVLQIWTFNAFALKGESMRMERFEDIEAWQPAREPPCKV